MILDEIIAAKRIELTAAIKKTPLNKIKTAIPRAPEPLSLASALSGGELRLIAEVKKASPSRGVIRADFDPLQIAEVYADCGAAAISVLTESRYFQGSLSCLLSIKSMLKTRNLPLIRKDFIFDPYQVYEARAYGADSLLLIARTLDKGLLHELQSLAGELGMDCLVEIHDEDDLKKTLDCDAKIIGINNRDLRTFKVDTEVTRRLRPLVPADKLIVSESGISHASDISLMRELKVNAVLVGEALTASHDIASTIKEIFS